MTDRSCTNFPASLGNVTFGANVGIGTTNPMDMLDLGSGGSVAIRIDPGNDATQGTVAYKLLSREAVGYTRTWVLYTAPVGGGYGVVPNSLSVWDYPGNPTNPSGWCCNPRLVILPTPNSGPAPRQLTIDGAGNLGLGTTTPQQPLSVAGAIQGQAVALSGDVLLIGNDTKLRDIDVANTAGLWGQQDPTKAGLQLGSGGPTLTGAGGNLGIGTASPAYPLDVAGTVHTNASVVAGSRTVADAGGCYYA